VLAFCFLKPRVRASCNVRIEADSPTASLLSPFPGRAASSNTSPAGPTPAARRPRLLSSFIRDVPTWRPFGSEGVVEMCCCRESCSYPSTVHPKKIPSSESTRSGPPVSDLTGPGPGPQEQIFQSMVRRWKLPHLHAVTRVADSEAEESLPHLHYRDPIFARPGGQILGRRDKSHYPIVINPSSCGQILRRKSHNIRVNRPQQFFVVNFTHTGLSEETASSPAPAGI
jgi:hypothetical protein